MDDSSQDRFIGPLSRDGTVGCSSDYSSPSYSYSSILNKSETGNLFLSSLLFVLFGCSERGTERGCGYRIENSVRLKTHRHSVDTVSVGV